MAIRVDVYTIEGTTSGTMSRIGSLREALARARA